MHARDAISTEIRHQHAVRTTTTTTLSPPPPTTHTGLVVVGWLGRVSTTLHCTHHVSTRRLAHTPTQTHTHTHTHTHSTHTTPHHTPHMLLPPSSPPPPPPPDLLFPWGFFLGDKNYAFFCKGMVFKLFLLLDMLVAKWEPTPCYRDAYSVGIPKGACGEKSGQMHKTTVSPVANVFFLVSKRTLFSGRWWYGCFILVGQGILGLTGGLSFLVNCLSNLPILVGG